MESLNKRINIHTSQNVSLKTSIFSRDDFSRLLFRCHNIIRNNDKLSPEAAFDEISKILFIKIRYEREQSHTQTIFSEEEFLNLKKSDAKVRGNENLTKPFYQYFFDSTKHAFEKDELFDPNDTLRLRESTFLAIIKELEKYNLSETSDDVKGIAFEEFLGRTFRGELGQFFTPRTVVDYVVDILEPQEGELICDPCCGSGGFLIKAFEYVRAKIEKDVIEVKAIVEKNTFSVDFNSLSDSEKESRISRLNKIKQDLESEIDLQNPNGRLYNLSHNCIFGTDANPRMARTAKMNMIMHGDGHGGVHHHDGLLNVNGIYEGRFDIILTNPPFGSRVDKSLRVTTNDIPKLDKISYYKQRYGEEYESLVVEPLRAYAETDNGQDKPKGKAILDLYELGEISGLTEVLFLERCLNLLKPGGRMGIVLPEGVLNNLNLQKIRDFVEGRAKLINITSIPQDVFMASGATVKSSLVFLKKFDDVEAKKYANLLKVESKLHANKYAPEFAKLKNQYQFQIREFSNEGSGDLKVLNKKYREQRVLLENELSQALSKSIKAEFSYRVPLVEVELAGISSTGTATDNELKVVAREYKEYRREHKLWDTHAQMQYFIPVDDEAAIVRTTKEERNSVNKNGYIVTGSKSELEGGVLSATTARKYLKIIEFNALTNWSVRFALESNFNYNEDYPLYRLGDFLRRNRTEVLIEDDVEYRRVTIRMNNKGVLLRDIKKGRYIGTKRQFLLKSGQFVLSKIDARNGSLGIAPPELDGAAITNDFLAFDIDKSVVNPYFLSLLTGTKEFIRFCQSCSSGSTNRQRLNESLFLNVQVPLPPLSKQEELVKSHQQAQILRAKAEAMEAQAITDFEKAIFQAS
jgi:type I restriction enzyme M protein